jgi:hypothetical protein
VKACEAEQARYKAAYRRVMWQVLHAAFLAGRFQRLGATWAEIRKVVDVQVEAPGVAARNKLEETSRRILLRDKGLLSGKTMTSEEGYDYEQEQANIKEEAPPEQSVVAGVMQKIMGPPAPPQQPGQPLPGQQPPGQPNPKNQPPSAKGEPTEREPLAEAIPPAVREAIATTLKEWRTP